MKLSMITGSAVAAACAVGLLAAPSALAAKSDPGPNAARNQANCTGDQQGRGGGYGGRNGQMQNQKMFEAVPSGTLTEQQKADLALMAEEEKLAHDLYIKLGKKYPKATIFTRIAASEQRHWDAVVRLLDRYDIPDPTAGMAAGKFASADIQTMYNDLLASATTRTAAYKVGVAVEKDDLAELDKADDGVTAPDVVMVYSHLTRGSEQHLAAFQSRL